MPHEVLLPYPDFTKPFEMHADASNYQKIGAALHQGGKPKAFHLKKLNVAQLIKSSKDSWISKENGSV
jgi:hypothetical protein